MQAVKMSLNLDFMENRTLQTLKVKQFENSKRSIRIYLYDNGSPISFDNTDVAVINASVNGVVTTYEENCTIAYDSNLVTVPLYKSLTTLSGTEHCEIKIKSAGSDRTIYTATFNLEVEPSVATTEYAETLKTTELAAVLKDHEERITALESSSGGVKTGKAVQVLHGSVGSIVGTSSKIEKNEGAVM